MLSEDGTYVDLEEEKEYSVVNIFLLGLHVLAFLLGPFVGDPKLHCQRGGRVQV